MASTLPLDISIAPFPEGFQGDMDETFQQAVQLMSGTVQGNFLTGLILPPGSTLPTSDQGPIAMNETWFFWDPATGQYLPQTATAKPSKNYCKNPIYQIAQQGNTLTPPAGISQNYDLALTRCTLGNTLAISAVVGPPAAQGNDALGSGIKYTVGPTLVSAPASTDLYAHEHLLEGCDIAMLQGQILTLSFFVWINTAGTYSVYLANSGRDHSYTVSFTISATQASNWTRIVVPGIPALPTATGTWNFGEGTTGLYIGFPFAVGAQWQTGALNAWNGALYCGSSANSNLMAVGNNQYAISGIKLEASVNAGYVVAPAFSDDFEAAQRYFYTTFNYQSVVAGFAIPFASPTPGTIDAQFPFPRRMAKVPTVTPFGYQSHASGMITDISTAPVLDIALAALNATQKGVSHSGAVNIVTTGTTNSTINITAIPSTAGMTIGMPISGSGIPAGTTIASIVSGTAITLSAAATSSGTGVAVTVNPTSKGDMLRAFIKADARLS
jgi:hypothetical protein